MNDNAGKWVKYLVEPNPGAMEAVLSCFLIFIDKCEGSLLATAVDKILAPLMDKCLGAAKPSLKVKSMDALLTLFEVAESFGEETLDALQALVKSPKPKVSRLIRLSKQFLTIHFHIDCVVRYDVPRRADESLRNQEVQPSQVWKTNYRRGKFFSASEPH